MVEKKRRTLKEVFVDTYGKELAEQVEQLKNKNAFGSVEREREQREREQRERDAAAAQKAKREQEEGERWWDK